MKPSSAKGESSLTLGGNGSAQAFSHQWQLGCKQQPTGVEARPVAGSAGLGYFSCDSLWEALQQFTAFTTAQRGCGQESGDPGTLFPQEVGTDAPHSIAAASGFVPGFLVPLSSAFST